MCPANERQCYIVTSYLISWVHTQNDPYNTNPGGVFYNPVLTPGQVKWGGGLTVLRDLPSDL